MVVWYNSVNCHCDNVMVVMVDSVLAVHTGGSYDVMVCGCDGGVWV